MINLLSLYAKFNKAYFLWAVLLFITEVLIAKYVHDSIVRPYIGDLLVVILIYCSWKAFFNTPIMPTAWATLLFAYIVETLQYFHFVKLIGLEQYALARVIIGTSFEWIDIVAYTAGVMIVIAIEKWFR